MAEAKKNRPHDKSGLLKRPAHADPSSENINLAAIRTGLLRWFRKSARKYPWRQTHNWFHLVMAELMLRRTRSDQVQSVYETFTKRYKNPARAHGDPDGVLDTIASLGLHWRNQQILDSIAFMSHTYGASTPKEQSDLTEIPGVGDYCNAMIRSRLYGDRLAAIDSNVARIYCRITGVPFHPEM
ncbi:MAG: hypothetical protein KDK37_10360, partial [Leptospiraceae bacterium]|nr:hypothetical protein [Leptospiraceae bacterium]